MEDVKFNLDHDIRNEPGWAAHCKEYLTQLWRRPDGEWAELRQSMADMRMPGTDGSRVRAWIEDIPLDRFRAWMLGKSSDGGSFAYSEDELRALLDG